MIFLSCLNFWDDAWFLSLRVFGLLSSYLFFISTGQNNKDEDNRPKAVNDKNNQVLSQKFRQLISSRYRPDIIYQWRQENLIKNWHEW